MASSADIDRAVAAARAALTGPWAALSPSERAGLTEAFAAELKSHARDTAALVSRENGPPIALSGLVNGTDPSAIPAYYAKLHPGNVSDGERSRPPPCSPPVVAEPGGG